MPVYSTRFLTIFLIILSVNTSVLSQSEEIKREALKNFKTGNYDKAFDTFNKLINNYPQQPDYNYYNARCIFELNKVQLFDYALQCFEIAAVYGKYYDAWFYTGRIHHIKNNYPEAIKAYKKFAERSNKKQIKQFELDNYISMAENELNNNLAGGETKLESNFEPAEKNDKHSALSVQTEYNNTEEFPEFYGYLKPALTFQLAADSFLRASKVKRAMIKETDNSEVKKKLALEVGQLETISFTYQKKADSLFNIIADDISEKNLKTDQYREKFRVNTEYSDPEQLSPADTLYYTIQLGIFSKKVGDSLFNAISPVFFIEQKNELVKYYKGVYLKYKEAAESLKNIKQSGFSDVFIVAFYNNIQISVEKAREIEYASIAF